MRLIPEEGLSRRLADTPIAVVGLGALFPQSRNVREFWRNIVAAADGITDIPDSLWRTADYYDPDPAAPDKTYCRRGGLLPPVPFHPLEFGIPPNILPATDIVQLLSLVVARDTLRDAGTAEGGWYDPERTGVVLGVSGPLPITMPLGARLQTPVLKEVARSVGLTERDADEVATRFAKAYVTWQENSFPGLLGNVVAGRVANRLNLGGMSCTVDAACASSLAATRSAVGELLDGRADMMLTGGCAVDNTVLAFVSFSKTPALSPSGNVRPFDASADGTLIGDGIGMLALRRLEDAERDGNRIYALLRGIGSASDGRFTSIYAPRREGQLAALRRAYADAGVSPATVELFEAHGTGTTAGDQVELSALTEILRETTQDKQYAAIGSVKSQIGHTKAAAGAAGLIKAALALHQQTLPPTIKVEKPNPAARLDETALYVNTRSRPWIRDPRRPQRRAAVSSFGFGGTNFHVVLEEYEQTGGRAPVLAGTARVACWHGADPGALAARVSAEPPLGEFVNAPETDARLGFVYQDDEEFTALRALAVSELRGHSGEPTWSHPRGIVYRRSALAPGTRTAALFAGQGSQYVDMGRTAALAIPPVRDAFEAANRSVGGTTALAGVVFPPPAFDADTLSRQEETLRRTEHAQPAIGAYSAGQFRWLSELGYHPDAVAGHSFGELTSLWAAGACDDAMFFELAGARGAAMAAPGVAGHDPGAMASVATSVERTEELLAGHPGVSICNVNAPNQTVVGGATNAVEQLVHEARAAGITASRLPVSAAFHTGHVAHAAQAFRAAVAKADLTAPTVPVYANTSGARYGLDAAANKDVLVRQLREPVMFADQLRRMYQDGCRVFVEFGPKAVLSGLARATLPADAVCVALDAGPRSCSDRAMKRAALELGVLGLPITGIGRYDAPPPVEPPTMGPAIELTGTNYVPDEYSAQYRAALAVPYQLEALTDDHDAPVPQTGRPANHGVESQMMPATANGRPDHDTVDVSTLITDQLAIHGEYLAEQLRLAHECLEALARPPAGGSTAELHAAIEAVKQYGATIADSHVRVNEAFLSFLSSSSSGTAAPAAPAYLESASSASPAPEPPAPAALPETGAQPAALPEANGQVVSTPPLPAPVVVAAEPDPAVAAEARAVAQPAAPAPDTERSAEVRSALLSVVADKTGYPVEMLNASMDIEADLGIDSIKRVEIVSVLQERFPGIQGVGPERLGELRTLDDVVSLLAASIENGAPPAGNHFSPNGSHQVTRLSVTREPLNEPQTLPWPYATNAVALVVDDGTSAAGAVVSALRAASMAVHVLALPGVATTAAGPDARSVRELPSWDEATLTGAVRALVAEAGRLDLCLQFCGAPAVTMSDAVRRMTHAVLVAKAVQGHLHASVQNGRSAYLVLSRADTGNRLSDAALGGVSGLARTLALEADTLFCRAVDVGSDLSDASVASVVTSEAADVDTTLTDVRYVAGRRSRSALTSTGPARLDGARPLGSDDLLVVSGGARGITAECLRALATGPQPALLILGRTPLAPEPPWAAGLDGPQLRAAIIEQARASGATPVIADVERTFHDLLAAREVRTGLAQLTMAGLRVSYLAVDILDQVALRAALAPYAAQVTGLVHGAGVLADRLIADKEPGAVEHVLSVKLTGLDHLLSTLDGSHLRHVVLFSSAAGLFGNQGQADYAMANEGLNRAAEVLRARWPQRRITSVNWGAWDGGMVTPQLREMFESAGVRLLSPAAGAEMFREQFAADRAGDTVVFIGPATPPSRRNGHPLSAGGTAAQTEVGAGRPIQR